MATNSPIEDQKDRRRYFRIDDEIKLIYSEVPGSEISNTERLERESLEYNALSSSLEILTQESRVILKKIERDQPDVADYLNRLERKIDLIAQTISMNDPELKDRTTRKVNISASGLAFDAEKSVEPGVVIELKMILPPSLITFVTYGKVIYCNTCLGRNEFSHRIGVDFLFLREQDRELLIRYIAKRQIQQIQEIRDQKQSA